MARTASSSAPSTRPFALQMALRAAWRQSLAALERWLEAERDQLPLWVPVMLGAGIALWFVLPDASAWSAAMLLATAAALLALAVGRRGRAARVGVVGAGLVAAGLALAWLRAEQVAAPVLAAPTIATFSARVERVEPLVARDLVRLRLAPIAVTAVPVREGGRGGGRVGGRGGGRGGQALPTLPPHIRVNLASADVPAGLAPGVTLSLSARLMPPPPPAVPGAYDYARSAWFDRIGATGRGFAPVTITHPAGAPKSIGLRAALSQHIQTKLVGDPGAAGIAAALAMGDQEAIPLADTLAMRRSGLAHLLSVSGLHITAAVGAVMLLTLRLLALSPWAALRWRLPMIAAGAGAVAAIGYTWLTGAEVPTIRSCVAALLVLTALALGRQALTLRLVAAGALIILLIYPDALVGPSFQLSFAAVAAIVALHEHPTVSGWFAPRDQGRAAKVLRELASLLLTGLVVELALMPIAIFHFHKAGVYGAFANIVAIPLTTFVTMPCEALALLCDVGGGGAPFWWLTARSLDLLLWIAHFAAATPGAVAPLPAMPGGAYALMVGGGLWIALWRTRGRRLGTLPLAAGALWALATPAPDLLVTGDGRHVAIRTARGDIALLRDRTGDYTADMLAENGGVEGLPVLWSEQRDARCSRDLCLALRTVGGRTWRVLATRSAYLVPSDQLAAACAAADIVISERVLPRRCAPRWLRLDRAVLAQSGGVAVSFAQRSLRTVRQPGDTHPWLAAVAVAKPRVGRRRRTTGLANRDPPREGD